MSRGIAYPRTNCTRTIRIARWERPACVTRTSYFMRNEYVSNIPSRSEVFAAASIRARRRRDRGAQGRVTATSVGEDLQPILAMASRICCLGISALSRDFLER